MARAKAEPRILDLGTDLTDYSAENKTFTVTLSRIGITYRPAAIRLRSHTTGNVLEFEFVGTNRDHAPATTWVYRNGEHGYELHAINRL
jgi:hypothetical protein